MTRASRLAALVAPLLLAACATTQGVPLPMSTPAAPKQDEFRATGEFRSTIGKSAAFDEWRVVGPRVNLTRNPDGTWDGTAGPAMTAFHLDVKPGYLDGPNLSLSIQKMADGVVEIGGLFFGDRYFVRVSPQKLQGKTHGGKCSFEFKRVSPAVYAGDIACGMEITRVGIELFGVASRVDDPVLPQAALALMAAMP
jgi:hypothetical protein